MSCSSEGGVASVARAKPLDVKTVSELLQTRCVSPLAITIAFHMQLPLSCCSNICFFRKIGLRIIPVEGGKPLIISKYNSCWEDLYGYYHIRPLYRFESVAVHRHNLKVSREWATEEKMAWVAKKIPPPRFPESSNLPNRDLTPPAASSSSTRVKARERKRHSTASHPRSENSSRNCSSAFSVATISSSIRRTCSLNCKQLPGTSSSSASKRKKSSKVSSSSHKKSKYAVKAPTSSHTVSTDATITLASSHTVSTDATIATASSHTVSTDATIAPAFSHTVSTDAAIAPASYHTASIASASIYTISEEAPVASASTHTISKEASIASVSTHTISEEAPVGSASNNTISKEAPVASASTHTISRETCANVSAFPTKPNEVTTDFTAYSGILSIQEGSNALLPTPSTSINHPKRALLATPSIPPMYQFPMVSAFSHATNGKPALLSLPVGGGIYHKPLSNNSPVQGRKRRRRKKFVNFL